MTTLDTIDLINNRRLDIYINNIVTFDLKSDLYLLIENPTFNPEMKGHFGIYGNNFITYCSEAGNIDFLKILLKRGDFNKVMYGLFDACIKTEHKECFLFLTNNNLSNVNILKIKNILNKNKDYISNETYKNFNNILNSTFKNNL